jgi:lipopolysaccharide/colanic/teichoic acid biosynthesis glycosyltransferase
VEGNGQDGTLDPDLARLMAHETGLRPPTKKVGMWAHLDTLTRRGADLAGAVFGLVALSPVMLGIALLIKLSSPGPVLFRQRRVGRNGKEFCFLKFRTMYHQCDQNLHRDYVTRLIEKRAETYEADGACYYKLVQDPRVTPLGKFLRTTSLDELPQFINVLKGEMSLVGPRPPIGYEVERYQTWQLRRILEAKPGITGLWQVCGRSCTTFDEQVRLDLQYVENQSLWLNVRIMAQTFRAVFSTRGAF